MSQRWPRQSATAAIGTLLPGTRPGAPRLGTAGTTARSRQFLGRPQRRFFVPTCRGAVTPSAAAVKAGRRSVELANAKVPYQGLSGAVACSTRLRKGTTVIHTRISAVYSTCGGPNLPSCANPNLPIGTYHTVVNWPTRTPHIPEPGRLYISVVR